MHDLSQPVTHAADHEALLRRALNAEVADVHLRPALDEILDAAPHRSWLCVWILAATVGLLALLAAAILWAAHAGHEPAPIPAHLTRLLEA